MIIIRNFFILIVVAILATSVSAQTPSLSEVDSLTKEIQKINKWDQYSVPQGAVVMIPTREGKKLFQIWTWQNRPGCYWDAAKEYLYEDFMYRDIPSPMVIGSDFDPNLASVTPTVPNKPWWLLLVLGLCGIAIFFLRNKEVKKSDEVITVDAGTDLSTDAYVSNPPTSFHEAVGIMSTQYAEKDWDIDRTKAESGFLTGSGEVTFYRGIHGNVSSKDTYKRAVNLGRVPALRAQGTHRKSGETKLFFAIVQCMNEAAPFLDGFIFSTEEPEKMFSEDFRKKILSIGIKTDGHPFVPGIPSYQPSNN